MTPVLIPQPFPSGPYLTNAYVVICADTKQALIIDPSPGSSPLIQHYLKTHHLAPQIILLTHTHWDHIADVHELKQTLFLPVWVHAWDLPNLESPGADGLPFPVPIEGVKADHLIEDGEMIPLGNCLLRVIHTPGHSAGSCCFYNVENQIIFTGDTLFRGAIGNISFPTSRPELMSSSLKRLAQLPSETRVYPGHGSSTTIGKESERGTLKE
jgi:hydroxyacylglutathione hydrolase